MRFVSMHVRIMHICVHVQGRVPARVCLIFNIFARCYVHAMTVTVTVMLTCPVVARLECLRVYVDVLK
jgi:hypothetical protein